MTAFPDGREISALLMFEDFKEFHSCQRFYNFLFPTSGCRKYHVTTEQVQDIRCTNAVNRRLSQFATDSWKNIPDAKRRSDTDNFLKVSSCLQIIGSDTLMVRWICEQENGFQKKARQLGSRLTNDQLVRNGMVAPLAKNESGRYEKLSAMANFGMMGHLILAVYAQKFRIEVSNILEELKRDHQQEEDSKDRENVSAEEDENADILDAAGESMEVEYTEEEIKDREKARLEARLEVNVTTMQKLYRRRNSWRKSAFSQESCELENYEDWNPLSNKRCRRRMCSRNILPSSESTHLPVGFVEQVLKSQRMRACP
ncbi:hypothetical protein OS493_023095 [Desmophyllum pertusum]|uniref:Uncharacterized protein n=1 Tax=Desmophyllum pertusum TaxID=174260 RepID=A0A9X0CPZ7_9CNID|nr:hypothetical protein OS493_023095 [Desmophyllum pertusum]